MVGSILSSSMMEDDEFGTKALVSLIMAGVGSGLAFASLGVFLWLYLHHKYRVENFLSNLNGKILTRSATEFAKRKISSRLMTQVHVFHFFLVGEGGGQCSYNF